MVQTRAISAAWVIAVTMAVACGDSGEVNTVVGGIAEGGAGGAGGASDGQCANGDPCGISGACCGESEECVNGRECLAACETERCGKNLTLCCAAGQECLNGESCAASCTAPETLCGKDLELCCGAGDVCLERACVTPGATCDNNFDCQDDGWYCEDALGKCLPLPQGPLCEGASSFNDIDPTEEWYWPGVDYAGRTYNNIIAAPSVGDVNGDGTPDVVVTVYSGTNGSRTLVAVLDGAGDGAGGPKLLFTIPSANDPTAPEPHWESPPALGNFDADPGLEIVYGIDGGGVVIADNDGIGDLGRRTTGSVGSARPAIPALADLNHDGMPDVVVRCHAMDGNDISDGARDLINASGCGVDAVVADLDQDGTPEVVDGAHAISADPLNLGTGTPLWTGSNGLTSGYVAVADILPGQAGPEVINIRSGFYLLDGQTGAVLAGSGGSLWSQAIPIPGSGVGGPPTVADFDGDGLPEISTAGRASYVVYDPDCANPPLRTGGTCESGNTNFVLWSTPTQDISSSRTGSSVFDFQGDGAAEVLYNDECFLHIYDGKTGAELLDPVFPNSSRTGSEYPLVADVDGDGNAEIVVVANGDQALNRDKCDNAWKSAGVPIDELCQLTSCTAGVACPSGSCQDVVNGSYIDAYQCDSNGICQLPGGTHGVRVYGDSFDRWVKTRTVWNQFSYHASNVELSNGRWQVPRTEQASWLNDNNYRQNVQGGALFPVPDLRVELTATPVCPAEVILTATVFNDGSAASAPGLEVAFHRTDGGASNPPELLGIVKTTTTILAGGSERVSFSFKAPPTSIDLAFSATTDPNAVIEECNEDNNSASANATCDPGPR